jgi:hypothetical protein
MTDIEKGFFLSTVGMLAAFYVFSLLDYLFRILYVLIFVNKDIEVICSGIFNF